jgi:DNA-binding LacI/PurR family transcriptional regulator
MPSQGRQPWTVESICQDLRRRILIHGFIDNVFPGEGALSHHYEVTIRMARRVIATLVEEGLLVCQRRNPCRVLPSAAALLRERALLTRVVMIAWHARDESYPFAHHVANGVCQRANPRKLKFEMIRLTPNEGEQRIEQIRAASPQTESTGWIIIHPRLSKEFLERWLLQNVPFVLADQIPSAIRVNAVAFDCEASVFQATEYLIELGHRRIACVGAIQDTSISMARQRGFRSALERHGVPLPPEYVADDLQHTGPDKGADITHQVATRLLNSPARPTAIVCFNNRTANAALTAAEDLKLRVPADLSVITASSHYTPELPRRDLTRVNEGRPEQIGELAFDLLTRPDATFSPVALLLRGHLIEGETTGPPPA